MLPSWNDTPTRCAIEAFLNAVTTEGGPEFVAPEERVAVFDNDGTLWCEKPMPVELGFILQRLAAMAEDDASLRDEQPWKAARERDYAWLADAMTSHYRGDDSAVQQLIGALLKAFEGWSVEDYGAAAAAFLGEARHPTLHRAFSDCGFVPMVELLRHLEAHGFTVYIASGGDRDFMRQITQAMYEIPPERVIGSSNALRYDESADGGAIVYDAKPEVFDDGVAKPVRIWSRIGRRPILACGNANGDTPMLRFAGGPGRRALRLLVLHDDDEREFAYEGGAEEALKTARAEGWTVISVKDDWATVFPGQS
jgi:phosphoserine phosphatase